MPEHDDRRAPARRGPHRQAIDALTHLVREVVAVLDEELVVTYVSESVTPVLGWHPDRWLGASALDLPHPDDAPEVAALLSIAESTTGQPASGVSTFRLLDEGGRWRWFEALAVDRRDDPDIGGLVLSLRDVTEQRRTEQRLERLELLAQSTTDLIGIVEPDGTPSFLNQSALELLGIEPDQVGARSIADIYTPAAWAVLQSVGIPATQRDGVWRGELEVRTASGAAIPVSQVMICHRNEDGDVEFFASISRDIRARHVLEAHLRRQAEHDELTGLPNRTPIVEHLRAELGAPPSGAGVAVVFLDLDRFKVVNDSLGHLVGDRVLCQIARRLADVVRDDDLAGRFGGDEFVVVRSGIDDPADALALAEQVRAALTGRVDVVGGDVHLTASVGVAVGRSGEAAEDVLRDADAALGVAKGRGRDAVVLFDQALRARAVARLQTERDLRVAVREEQFELRYQPIVDLHSGEVHAFEALLRWAHPTRGLLLPAAFLDVAEETGLIVEIGRWVVAEACREAGGWARVGASEATPPPSIFVNLSARELLEHDLPALVAACVRSAGLRPLQLHLEITEQTIMTDVDTAGAIVRGIREGGVRFALDDFGTGQSSLAYLRQFPIGVVKIDRSFVTNLSDPVTAAIIEGVVALAERLSTTTIAEGIETPEQAAALRELGCAWGQGNLFSIPLTADAAARLARPRARVELPT